MCQIPEIDWNGAFYLESGECSPYLIGSKPSRFGRGMPSPLEAVRLPLSAAPASPKAVFPDIGASGIFSVNLEVQVIPARSSLRDVV
jgi:hypothetical protein